MFTLYDVEQRDRTNGMMFDNSHNSRVVVNQNCNNIILFQYMPSSVIEVTPERKSMRNTRGKRKNKLSTLTIKQLLRILHGRQNCAYRCMYNTQYIICYIHAKRNSATLSFISFATYMRTHQWHQLTEKNFKYE